MPISCVMCEHPKRDELERLILTKAITQLEASRRAGCSTAAVSRHVRNHVSQLVKKETLQDRAFNVVSALHQSHDNCRTIFKDAIRRKNPKVALKALEVELRQLEAIGKMTNVYSEAPQILMIDQRFGMIRDLLLTELAGYPDLKLKLAEALEQLTSDAITQVDVVDEEA